MRPRRGLVILGVLTLVVGIIALFPARVAYHWFIAPSAEEQLLRMSGLSGTFWSGEARELSAGGVYLSDVRWNVKPLHLLTGKIVLALEASPVSGFVETDVIATLNGKLSLTNLTASLPLAPLAQPFRVPGLQGSASLQFDRITVTDGLPVAADGVLTVADFSAAKLFRGPLGGYKVEFFTQNNGIAASIEDTDGVVDLAGSLKVNADRSYQFLGKVAAKANTPQALRNQFRALGNPDDRGQYELRLEGVL